MSDKKDSDIGLVNQGATEKDLENIELKEKTKEGKEKFHDGEKAKTTDDSGKKGDKESPISKAFFISKYITFWWMSDLFSLGYKKPLDESDLSKQPYADTCDPLSEKFEREWEKESLDSDGKLRENANLLKVFWRCFGLQYAALGILVVFSVSCLLH